MSIWDFPEILSQAMLGGMMLVGRLGVHLLAPRRAPPAAADGLPVWDEAGSTYMNLP